MKCIKIKRIKSFDLRTFIGLASILVLVLFAPPALYDRITPLFLRPSTWEVKALGIFVIVGFAGLTFLLLTAAVLSHRVVRWLMFVLLATSLAAMGVFLEVTHHVLQYPDWLVLWQAKVVAGDAVAEYSQAIIPVLPWVGLLLVPFLCIRQRVRYASVIACGLFVTSVVLFTGVCVVKQGGATNKLPSLTAIYGLATAQAFDSSRDRTYVYATTQNPITKPAFTHIVLVVDESVRWDYFAHVIGSQIGEHLGGWTAYNFGMATSMANCSAASNLMLRKAVSAKTISHDVYNNPLIWSLAHNAGFTTWLLDAQRHGMGGNDHFGAKELSLIDHVPQTPWKDDAAILTSMGYLQEAMPSFSYIIKKGVHFPYRNKFPQGYRSSYLDDAPPYVASDSRRITYVNGLDYQTGGFFRKLATVHTSEPTLIVYTSDHGQNVDDNPGQTHCTASRVPPQVEGVVPFVVLTNRPNAALAKAQTLNKNTLTHFQLIQLVLGAMGYHTPWAAPVLKTNRPNATSFAYGSPYGFFGRKVRTRAVNHQKYVQRWAKRWH